MSNQTPKSKPEDAEQPSGEGLSSSALLALICDARDLIDGELGDSDPIDSNWELEDYPLIGAFQKLNEAVGILRANDQV